MSKRLFVALELPDGCRECLVALGRPMHDVRWLDKDQLHLTLAFLGSVTTEEESSVRLQLAEIRVPPFFLAIQGVGVFGSETPSVVWAGVGKGHPHLFALHKRVHDALCAAHLDPELRPFHPHITLARVKNVPAQVLRPFLRDHENEEFCLVPMTSFALYSSQPGSSGYRYTVEQRYELSPRH